MENKTVQVCRDCGDRIIWLPTNDGRRNRWGQPLHLPYNYPDTSIFHRCEEYLERIGSQYQGMPNKDKSKGIPCRICGSPITFSGDQRSSETGKMIPLELTGEPHHHRVKEEDAEEEQEEQEDIEI